MANNGSTPTNKGDSENQANYSSTTATSTSSNSNSAKKASAGKANVKSKTQSKSGVKEKSRGKSQNGPSLLNFFAKKQFAPLVTAQSSVNNASITADVASIKGDTIDK